MKENIQLKAKVKIANPINPSKYEEVELIIDTGAMFSVVNKNILKKIGITPIRKRKIKVADGRIGERESGVALFIINGKGEGGSEVIFGEENDTQVLGLHALEGMALSINTKTGELNPIEIRI